VNGRSAKPATLLVVGDRVAATVHGDERDLEVSRIIDKRVGAPVAIQCFIDHSPPPAPRDRVVPLFTRDRATGRPTKRERRQLDRFRRR
jgi:ribosome-associated heat shock protein Hsp15